MLEKNRIWQKDCLEALKEVPSNVIDCCVTDPPYGIKFMGKKWDHNVPPVEVWKQILRVLKPGAHVLAACATRTQHRMAINIEDAGFEIRDVITWHYGTGFPKSMNIQKELDKKYSSDYKPSRDNRQGFSRINQGKSPSVNRPQVNGPIRHQQDQISHNDPKTEPGAKWQGWGTVLKPATEFWTLARKPFEGAKTAENMTIYGVGGLNIDASRIHSFDAPGGAYIVKRLKSGATLNKTGGNWRPAGKNAIFYKGEMKPGRFPANLILDEYAAELLDEQSGTLESGQPSGIKAGKEKGIFGKYAGGQPVTGYGDVGGASRFFYVAKADAAERGHANSHPTVKPLALMTYLIKLICPIEQGRIVLDPFAGSGTTCIAAFQLHLDFLAYEIDPENAKIAENRLRQSMGLFYGV
ncbi:MAG: site-specific DNA-methyltransferase [Puia sp.]|nr:site-specific DNA-methyltransferase [Puia sp.]